MLDEHIDMVGAALYKARDTMENYLNENLDEAKASAREVDELESEADSLLRGIIGCLQGGAFLQSMSLRRQGFRSRLHRLLWGQ